MDYEKLIESARTLAEFCGEQKITDCFGGRCMFSDGQKCILNSEPCEWGFAERINDDD